MAFFSSVYPLTRILRPPKRGNRRSWLEKLRKPHALTRLQKTTNAAVVHSRYTPAVRIRQTQHPKMGIFDGDLDLWWCGVCVCFLIVFTLFAEWAMEKIEHTLHAADQIYIAMLKKVRS